MAYSMVLHTVVELWGDMPPPNLMVFFGVYATYLLTPLVVMWRMWDAKPFGYTA